MLPKSLSFLSAVADMWPLLLVGALAGAAGCAASSGCKTYVLKLVDKVRGASPETPWEAIIIPRKGPLSGPLRDLANELRIDPDKPTAEQLQQLKAEVLRRMGAASAPNGNPGVVPPQTGALQPLQLMTLPASAPAPAPPLVPRPGPFPPLVPRPVPPVLGDAPPLVPVDGGGNCGCGGCGCGGTGGCCKCSCGVA